MQAHHWVTGPRAWAAFCDQHPELGYTPSPWAFHNFLRFFKHELLEQDAIRLAKSRHWIAHVERFEQVAFACATGHIEELAVK
jgi:hypothetical protein